MQITQHSRIECFCTSLNDVNYFSKSKTGLLSAAAMIALLLFGSYKNVQGQAASATWTLTASAAVTSTSGNVTASAMTTGPGVSSVSYTAVDGVTSQGWNSASEDANDYYQFSVTPNAGTSLTINNVSATTGKSGGASGTAIWKWSTVSTFTSSVTTIGTGTYAITTSPGATYTAAPTAIANNGQTLYVRVYAYNLQNSARTFNVKNVVLSGTTATCPSSPSASNDGPQCVGGSLRLYSSASGSAPLSYAWSGPSSYTSATQNPMISGVATANSGNYTVTISNSCGSTSAVTSAVINPNPAAPSASNSGPVCVGNNLSLSASGAVGTYNWTGPAGFASALQNPVRSNASGAFTGTYSVTVSVLGCISPAGTTMAVVNANPSTSMSKTDGSCVLSNNSATATPSGGTAPYSYLWSPGGGITQTISGLSAGPYTCTVTDNKGCTASGTVSISTPVPVNFSITKTDSVCTTSQGSAAAVSVTGVAPFAYSWSNGATTAGITNIPSGSYNCTVTASNGCTNTKSVPIIGLPCGITQLKSEFCGITITTFNQVLQCFSVGGATDYQWKVEDLSTSFLAFYQRKAIATDFKMGWIPGIQNSTTYTVSVRAFVGNAWKNFGPVCTVTTPGPPYPQLATSSCGIALTTFNQSLQCYPITGATDYQYKAEDASTGFVGYYQRQASATDFALSRVPGIQGSKTYSVSVRAFTGAWGTYGPACTLTTPAGPKLAASYCGITLSTLDQQVQCTPITGATDYQYKVENASTGFVGYYQRMAPATDFALSRVPGVTGGNTYTVSVRPFITGAWGGYGDGCTLTAPPAVMLAGGSCGVTVAVLSQQLNCTPASGATDYRYKLDDGVNPVLYYQRNASSTDLKLSWVSGIQNGTTYSVTVSAYIGGVWGGYGPVCAVTTPPAARLAAGYCNIALTSISQYLQCTSIYGATDYQYEVTDGGSFTAYYQRKSYATDFRLSWIPGIVNSTIYFVRVRAFAGGIWNSFGTTCTVTTPATHLPTFKETAAIGSGLEIADEEILLYPNPCYGNTVNIRINHVEEAKGVLLEVFNSLGVKVYSQTVDYSSTQSLGVPVNENLSEGIYFLHATIDDKKYHQMFVIIK